MAEGANPEADDVKRRRRAAAVGPLMVFTIGDNVMGALVLKGKFVETMNEECCAPSDAMRRLASLCRDKTTTTTKYQQQEV